MFPVKLQVLWEGHNVWSLWLGVTDPGLTQGVRPVLGWGFLNEGLGWGSENWDSDTPAPSFLLPAPSCQSDGLGDRAVGEGELTWVPAG